MELSLAVGRPDGRTMDEPRHLEASRRELQRREVAALRLVRTGFGRAFEQRVCAEVALMSADVDDDGSSVIRAVPTFEKHAEVRDPIDGEALAAEEQRA